MSSIDANHSGRRPRLWIVETLVVLGIVVFGYFALTMDKSPTWPDAEPANPLLELIR